MFSSRLPSLATNRISRAVEAARESGRAIIDLTETNPTAVGLDYPEREIREALADPRSLAYTPSPRGLDEARAAAAETFARHGARVDPAHVLLTASTSEAYALLFKLLCDPGDEVLVPRPSYPLFDHLAGLESVATTPYPLGYHHGWFLDVDEVRRRLTGRTRALITVNPGNPTGTYLTRMQASELASVCAEAGIAIVSDEVFADYAYEPDPQRMSTLAAASPALTFCLSGLSKMCGLPQLKLGWIAVSGPSDLVTEAETRLEHVADTYLSVGAPVMHAAERLIALRDVVGQQLRVRVQKNRAFLASALRDTAMDLLRAEGGWCGIVRVPRVHTEEEWVLALLEAGVLVHPGFFFDLDDEAYLIVSLIIRENDFEAGVRRLLRVIEGG